MDNLTHSLVGIALADLFASRRAPKLGRPMLAGAGIVSANLPDVDLVYSGITSPPLGYLLHHRGHTHTVIGLVVLAVLLTILYRVVPSIRKLPAIERWRLWMIILLGLASHLLMDALNSYGVHPFYPVDSRWYYGDAVFIFEPGIWLVLGVAAAWNARSRTVRLASWLPLVLLLLAIASMGIVPAEALAALAMTGLACTSAARRLSPRMRAAAALAATGAIAGAMLVVSREARAETINLLEREVPAGRLVDVILTPNPSSPLCWGVIGVELNDRAGSYRLWRGSLSLAPRWKSPTACASHALVGSQTSGRMIGDGRFALRDELDLPLHELRNLARRDCWARAWLRFARAPVVHNGQVFDLRFANRGTQNFTDMRLARKPDDPACPRFVPAWAMPRADLINTR